MTITEERTLQGFSGRNDFLVCCDGRGCKAAVDAKDRTFGQAIIYIKALGWRVKHLHGSFLHTCPKCQKEQAHE